MLSLSTTYSKGAWFIGCFKDSVAARDLPVLVSWDDSALATAVACTQMCGARGYTYAGVQTGPSCFCGNTVGLYGPANGQCAAGCPGDATQACGGNLRNAVYNASYYVPLPSVQILNANAFSVGSASALAVAYTGPPLTFTWTGGIARPAFGPSPQLLFAAGGVLSISCTAANAVMSATTTATVFAAGAVCAAVSPTTAVLEPGAAVALQVTLQHGYAANLSITGDAALGMVLADPVPARVGPAWAALPPAAAPASQALVVAAGFAIPAPGTVEAVEVDATGAGVLQLHVVRPACPLGTAFCAALHACNATCTPSAVSCAANETFCGGIGRCLAASLSCADAVTYGAPPAWTTVRASTVRLPPSH